MAIDFEFGEDKMEKSRAEQLQHVPVLMQSYSLLMHLIASLLITTTQRVPLHDIHDEIRSCYYFLSSTCELRIVIMRLRNVASSICFSFASLTLKSKKESASSHAVTLLQLQA